MGPLNFKTVVNPKYKGKDLKCDIISASSAGRNTEWKYGYLLTSQDDLTPNANRLRNSLGCHGKLQSKAETQAENRKDKKDAYVHIYMKLFLIYVNI